MIIFILLIGSLAHSNDSLVSLEGGSLKFERSSEVAIKSEALHISQFRVRVEYIFENLSNVKTVGMVSFPMPEFQLGSPMSVDPEDWENGKDPLNFKLWIDRNETRVKPMVRKSRDTMQVHYMWKQEFPPHKKLLVKHEYHPILGTGGGGVFSAEDLKRYCIDKAFLRTFDRLKEKALNTRKKELAEFDGSIDALLHYRSFSRFSYILSTGSHWAGPIKEFKLTIEKKKPSSLVSLCWKGLKRSSPTTFTSALKDFTPKQELEVLFVDEP